MAGRLNLGLSILELLYIRTYVLLFQLVHTDECMHGRSPYGIAIDIHVRSWLSVQIEYKWILFYFDNVPKT